MINWDNFYVFAAVSICLWLIGAVFALRSSTRSKTAIGFTSEWVEVSEEETIDLDELEDMFPDDFCGV